MYEFPRRVCSPEGSVHDNRPPLRCPFTRLSEELKFMKELFDGPPVVVDMKELFDDPPAVVDVQAGAWTHALCTVCMTQLSFFVLDGEDSDSVFVPVKKNGGKKRTAEIVNDGAPARGMKKVSPRKKGAAKAVEKFLMSDSEVTTDEDSLGPTATTVDDVSDDENMEDLVSFHNIPYVSRVSRQYILNEAFCLVHPTLAIYW